MLKIDTKATNIEITPDIERYCGKKIAAIKKYIDRDDTSAYAQVELEKTTDHHRNGRIYRSEINIHTRQGIFRAEGLEETMPAAIDEMRNDIERKLRKAKGKIESKTKSGGRKVKKMLLGTTS